MSVATTASPSAVNVSSSSQPSISAQTNSPQQQATSGVALPAIGLLTAGLNADASPLSSGALSPTGAPIGQSRIVFTGNGSPISTQLPPLLPPTASNSGPAAAPTSLVAASNTALDQLKMHGVNTALTRVKSAPQTHSNNIGSAGRLITKSSMTLAAGKKRHNIKGGNLVAITADIFGDYSEQFASNPLVLGVEEISNMRKDIWRIIQASKAEVDQKEKESKVASENCCLRPECKKITLISKSSSVTAVFITTVVAAIANGGVTSLIALAAASWAAASSWYGDLSDKCTDSAREAEEKAKAAENIARLNHVKLFNSALKDLKKLQESATNSETRNEFDKHFKEFLNKFKDLYTRNSELSQILPPPDKLVSSLVNGLPENHPLKQSMQHLFKLAVGHNDQFLNIEQEEPTGEAAEKEHMLNSSFSSRENAASAAPSVLQVKSLQLELSPEARAKEACAEMNVVSEYVPFPVNNFHLRGTRLNLTKINQYFRTASHGGPFSFDPKVFAQESLAKIKERNVDLMRRTSTQTGSPAQTGAQIEVISSPKANPSSTAVGPATTLAAAFFEAPVPAAAPPAKGDGQVVIEMEPNAAPTAISAAAPTVATAVVSAPTAAGDVAIAIAPEKT